MRLAVWALAAMAACKSSEIHDEPFPGSPPPPTTTLPQTCGRELTATTPPATCNGDAALCGKTYDQVTVPMTHNAMSSPDDGFGIPNQHHGIAKQLADGIRGMMLDIHYYDPSTNLTDTGRVDGPPANDQVYLCHGPCALGRIRLLDALCGIQTFLDANRGEVLTIIFETYVADADLDAVLRASGIVDYAYVHPSGAPWPTLRDMIDSGKRLVVFLEKGGGTPGYLMPAYEGNIWDTPYSFATEADFTCALGRGIAGSPLFLVNHWLSNPLSDEKYAQQVNVEAVLGKRVADCTAAAGRAPTFVSVDFYDIGDLFGVVRKTNGL
jgi:hypothetical protein